MDLFKRHRSSLKPWPNCMQWTNSDTYGKCEVVKSVRRHRRWACTLCRCMLVCSSSAALTQKLSGRRKAMLQQEQWAQAAGISIICCNVHRRCFFSSRCAWRWCCADIGAARREARRRERKMHHTERLYTRSCCLVCCVDLVLSGRLPVGALVGLQERTRRRKGERPEGVWGGCSSLWVKWRAPYDRRGYTASLAHHRQWGAAPLRLAWVSGGVPTRVTPHQKAST